MYLSCLLLAAGQSRRFAGIKQLARVNGQPLINTTVDNYLSVNIDDILLILGANADKIAPVLPRQLSTFVSKKWQGGMGNSLADAMTQVSAKATHVLVGLADQPGITKTAIESLITGSRREPDKIVASTFAEVVGAPAIFPQQFFCELAALNGDKGAKLIIQQHLAQVVTVEIPAAQWDIDTREDLDTWLNKR